MKNTIHMLDAVTGTQMNSFIITTEGGKVIVIDGGFSQNGGNGAGVFGSGSAVLNILGGTFTVPVEEAWCAGGFIPTENADGTYGVKVGLKGTGTEADPFLINNVNDLLWFQAEVDKQAADGSKVVSMPEKKFAYLKGDKENEKEYWF